METLKKKGINGIIWDLAGKFSNQAITFIVSIFLARLLTPDEFGLVGMVMVIIPIAQVFMSFGFGAAIIQKKNVTSELYSSVFWLNVLIGFLLTAIFFFSANIIANFYDRKELAPLIQIVSLIFIISSLGVVQTLRFTKEIDFKSQSIINITSALLSGVVGITLAINQFGVYALVYQKLTGVIISVSIYWVISKWKPRFYFSIKEIKSIWNFSIKYFYNGLITTLYNKLDIIMIGKVFNANMLGFYTRAQTLDTMVNNFSSGSLIKVFFPLVSKIQDQPEKIKLVYQKSMRIVGFLSIGLTFWLFITANELFVILFTKKWLLSAWMFKIMAIYGFTYPLSSIMISLIQGVGLIGKNLILGTYRKILGIISLGIGVIYGIEAFLYACIFRNVFGLVINMFFIQKITAIKFLTQLSWFIKPLAVAIINIVLIYYIFNIENLYLSFILKSFIFITLYILLTFFIDKSLIKMVLNELNNFFGNRINKIFFPTYIRENNLKKDYLRTLLRRKKKVFVIGFNKTGTTTLHKAINELGYISGKQHLAELLLPEITKGNLDNLFKYCKTAEAFQDIPFSLPEIYKELDKKFPNSKFILSIRDDENQWFQSICKFHAKLYGKDGRIPTKEDLENSNYVFKGYPLLFNNYVFGNHFYEKNIYTKTYNKHINDVVDYFKNKSHQLLVINVSEESSYTDMCKFLNVTPLRTTFEWKNKTEEL